MAGIERFLRSHRLRRAAEFERVYAEGVRVSSPVLQVVAARGEAGAIRLGVSVGKRHARRAVRRNALKRILREAFRRERERLPRGIDFVLVPGRGLEAAALGDVRREVVALLERAAARLAKTRERGSPA